MSQQKKRPSPDHGSQLVLQIRIIRTPSGGHRVWIERSPDPNRKTIEIPESKNPGDLPGLLDPIN